MVPAKSFMAYFYGRCSGSFFFLKTSLNLWKIPLGTELATVMELKDCGNLGALFIRTLSYLNFDSPCGNKKW